MTAQRVDLFAKRLEAYAADGVGLVCRVLLMDAAVACAVAVAWRPRRPLAEQRSTRDDVEVALLAWWRQRHRVAARRECGVAARRQRGATRR